MAPDVRQTLRMERVGLEAIWIHLLLLSVSALLLGLSFPQPGWGMLAHVALVPAAILAVRSAGIKRLAWTAWVVWTLWWLVMIRWMIPVTAGGYVALSMIMAAYFTAALVGLRLLDRRWRLPMVVALPMVWVSLEYLRSTVPQGGFGWFALAHSQAPHSDGDPVGRLVQIADMFGQWGVSVLVATTNGLIVDVVLRPLVSTNERGVRRTTPAIRGGLILWLAALLTAWGYGTFRIGQTPQVTSPGPTLAVIQTNVPQDNKVFPTADDIAADWQRMVVLTYEAAGEAARQQRKPAIYIWPETMVPVALNAEAIAYYQTLNSGAHEFSAAIGDIARDLQAHLVVGAHANSDWRQLTRPDGRTISMPAVRYNSAYLYHPDGRQDPQRYDKIHRVPFGEYVPWVDGWPWLKGHFIRLFTPYQMDYSLRAGERWTVFEVPWSGPPGPPAAPGAPGEPTPPPLRLVTPICFEDAIAAVTRRLLYEGGVKRADVLVNLTNDGWFAGTDQPWQHLQIAVLRSIENRVPSVRSVNTGVSGFIDSVGRIGPLVRRNGSATQVDGSAYDTIRLDRRVTLFGRLGNTPVVVLTCVTLTLLAVAALRRRRGG